MANTFSHENLIRGQGPICLGWQSKMSTEPRQHLFTGIHRTRALMIRLCSWPIKRSCSSSPKLSRTSKSYFRVCVHAVLYYDRVTNFCLCSELSNPVRWIQTLPSNHQFREKLGNFIKLVGRAPSTKGISCIYGYGAHLWEAVLQPAGF